MVTHGVPLLAADSDAEQGATKERVKKSPLWWHFCGTGATIFIAWCFAGSPENLWIVYLCVFSVLMAVRVRNVSRPRMMKVPGHDDQKMIRVLYLFEFCYVCNYIFIVILLILAVDAYVAPGVVTLEWRKRIFSICWGCACGPLLCAAIFPDNQLVFDDNDKLNTVCIHLFPALVMYCLTWHHDKATETWPGMFTGFMHSRTSDASQDIIVSTGACYVGWWLIYITWLMTFGLRLPKRKGFDVCLRLNKKRDAVYDTVFHFNMRQTLPGIHVLRRVRFCSVKEWDDKCNNHDFDCLDVVAYFMGHSGGALATISGSVLLFWHRWLHGLICTLGVVNVVFNSASLYAVMRDKSERLSAEN